LPRSRDKEPLLDESEQGAYSFAPGISQEELRRNITGREFQSLQRRLRETRRPAEWRASFLCEIHRDIFGEDFPESAERFRTGEALYGARAAVPPEHVASLFQQLILEIQDDLRTATKMDMDEAFSDHVFLSAARHHAKMVNIHPFVDGNGRWSVLLQTCIIRRP
jgi:fido (protein-threonine AMPylation protein)